MTRQHQRFIGQLGKLAQRCTHLLSITAREIGSADRGAEQRVSRNKNISAIKVLARIRFKEQADSARRMARRGNNAPCHIAQAQLIAIFQEMINLA